MNTKAEETSPSLPTLTITPSMVKRVLKKQNMSVRTADAFLWLLRHKKRIESSLLCATVDQVEDVVLDTTLVAWPDPEFHRMYWRIDEAIYDAISDYLYIKQKCKLTICQAACDERITSLDWTCGCRKCAGMNIFLHFD